MIELRQTRRQALLARLYWRSAVPNGDGSYIMAPRRLAWIIRPLMGFESLAHIE